MGNKLIRYFCDEARTKLQHQDMLVLCRQVWNSLKKIQCKFGIKLLFNTKAPFCKKSYIKVLSSVQQNPFGSFRYLSQSKIHLLHNFMATSELRTPQSKIGLCPYEQSNFISLLFSRQNVVRFFLLKCPFGSPNMFPACSDIGRNTYFPSASLVYECEEMSPHAIRRQPRHSATSSH